MGAALLLACSAADEETWAWKKSADGGDATAPEAESAAEGEDDGGRSTREGKLVDFVGQDVDEPNAGNSSQPRHIIRDRLCDLGLGSVSILLSSYDFNVGRTCSSRILADERLGLLPVRRGR